ncbi:MAG: hypothetical protein E7050_05630 [Lentisphaerae bacterium]|nr:hypothetical protein [Lentisphaerota bacterium]
MAKYLPGFSGFGIGVNYWASNAGTRMWSKFSAGEVDADFAALHGAGVNTVRIFPLWQDFQPVMEIAEWSNYSRELGFPDGTPLPATGLKSYGIDPVMMERFRIVADLADKHGLKLIVGLLTGWMSGGMFVPHALSGKDLTKDFRALRIADMFIRGFVMEMKDHPAIIAWEPGNECDCLSYNKADCAWNFLNMATSAIRLADPGRPVFSGMHGGKTSFHHSYDLITQGKLCDALTTHPYPAFTPHCGKSALNTIPAIYHATAETVFYRGVSGKPAFIEEIGAFGPGYLSEERTEKYLYTQLYSALVHDLGSVLWWCGFSFDRCAGETPYRWGAMERELGAFKSDRSADGAARAMKKFSEEKAKLPEFSSREIDAVVVISTLEDAWRAAYGSFILSKQAGFEIEYCHIASIDALPESKFYIVPSITGYEVMDVHKYHLLLDAARNGATVVFTADSGFLQPFDAHFGATVDYRTEEPETTTFTLDGKTFTANQKITRRMKAVDCEVLASDTDGFPVILKKDYGKGKLVFVNAALENNALVPGNELYLVYRKLGAVAGLELPEKSPEIGITRHKTADGRVLKFYINYSDETVDGISGNSVKYEIL